MPSLRSAIAAPSPEKPDPTITTSWSGTTGLGRDVDVPVAAGATVMVSSSCGRAASGPTRASALGPSGSFPASAPVDGTQREGLEPGRRLEQRLDGPGIPGGRLALDLERMEE